MNFSNRQTRKSSACAAIFLLLNLFGLPMAVAQTDEPSFEERLDRASSDEALQIGDEVHETLLYQDPEKARELMLLAVQRSEGHSDRDLHSKVLRGIAVTFAIQNDLDEAGRYYTLAMEEAKKGEGKEIPRLTLNMGILEQQREQFAKALELFQDALDMTAERPPGPVEALAHYHIALQMDAMGLSGSPYPAKACSWNVLFGIIAFS